MAEVQRNQALAEFMARAEVSRRELARRVGTDEKTVSRWLSGRQRPHPDTQAAVSKVVGARTLDIWPRDDLAFTAPTEARDRVSEVVGTYARRADTPVALRAQLLCSAMHRIDLVGYAMLFLPEQHPGLANQLDVKAASGCDVRIALADPTSQRVADRGIEEGMTADGMSARIRNTLHLLSPLRGSSLAEVRLYDAPMYNTVLRFDDDMLVTPHLFRTPGSEAPLLHLHRRPDGIFDRFVHHVDSVWDTASPAWQED